MKRPVFLIHWNEAEAETYAEELRASGWDVETEAQTGRQAHQRVRETNPAAVVVYLTRLPSHGRVTAESLRQTRATREIPLFFVGGAGEALRKTQDAVPQARFLTAAELPGALEPLRGA